jgi:hypothetical protein
MSADIADIIRGYHFIARLFQEFHHRPADTGVAQVADVKFFVGVGLGILYHDFFSGFLFGLFSGQN